MQPWESCLVIEDRLVAKSTVSLTFYKYYRRAKSRGFEYLRRYFVACEISIDLSFLSASFHIIAFWPQSSVCIIVIVARFSRALRSLAAPRHRTLSPSPRESPVTMLLSFLLSNSTCHSTCQNTVTRCSLVTSRHVCSPRDVRRAPASLICLGVAWPCVCVQTSSFSSFVVWLTQ